jgi:hypothetical protein
MIYYYEYHRAEIRILCSRANSRWVQYGRTTLIRSGSSRSPVSGCTSNHPGITTKAASELVGRLRCP